MTGLFRLLVIVLATIIAGGYSLSAQISSDRIVRAEAEREAADKLSQAANVIGTAPGALELRRLQTLAEIGVEHNTTIVAMLPVELIHAARKIAGMPEATATDE